MLSKRTYSEQDELSVIEALLRNLEKVCATVLSLRDTGNFVER